MLRWVTGTQLDEFVSFHDMRYDWIDDSLDQPCHVPVFSNLSQNSEMLSNVLYNPIYPV
jgi:hypothetical protein